MGDLQTGGNRQTALPKDREGAAVFGAYTRGGTVVTVGTTDWAHGLRGKDPHVERITANVLNRPGEPPRSP